LHSETGIYPKINAKGERGSSQGKKKKRKSPLKKVNFYGFWKLKGVPEESSTERGRRPELQGKREQHRNCLLRERGGGESRGKKESGGKKKRKGSTGTIAYLKKGNARRIES